MIGNLINERVKQKTVSCFLTTHIKPRLDGRQKAGGNHILQKEKQNHCREQWTVTLHVMSEKKIVNCSASPQWVVNVYTFGLKSNAEGNVTECFEPRGRGGGGGRVLQETLGGDVVM